ncbi:MAG: endonuclease/exonuclease/phosphatase family protein [Desulfosarcina sp.]|nr:endonuclease/exonuclease/phosphatase family protein [Desulfobacterales bacterium]
MPSIKILSWNIEHFKMGKTAEVAQIIQGDQPDVFALYEVEAAPIYQFMIDNFPNHSVFITEGQQSQEILVACRNTYEGIKFQQKKAFRSGNPRLRPGAFLSFRYPRKGFYNFLFLHTDSGTGAVDFGNRNEMFEHGFNLKRVLDDVTGEETNFMILGDLNTMGLKYPRQWMAHQIARTGEEVAFIDYESQRKGRRERVPNMRRLTKPEGTHFSTRYGISDLDHFIASAHLAFKEQQSTGELFPHEVLLQGWRDFPEGSADREQYADDISDHCLLFCELKVD